MTQLFESILGHMESVDSDLRDIAIGFDSARRVVENPPDTPTTEDLWLLRASVEQLRDFSKVLKESISSMKSSLDSKHFTSKTITAEDLQVQLNEFLLPDLPTVNPPYGPFCGRIQLPPMRIPSPNSWVCMRINDSSCEYVLGYLVDCDVFGICCVYDVPPEGQKVNPRAPDVRQLLVLPQSLPRKLGTEADYAVNDRVLALFFDQKEWTTAFYPATVREGRNRFGRGYSLEFDGEEGQRFWVPEKFIVPRPPEMGNERMMTEMEKTK
jgi:hypothetical protein